MPLFSFPLLIIPGVTGSSEKRSRKNIFSKTPFFFFSLWSQFNNFQHWLARWSSIKDNNKNYHSDESHAAFGLFSQPVRHCFHGSWESLSALTSESEDKLEKQGSKIQSLFWIVKACDEPGNWSPLLMGHLVRPVASLGWWSRGCPEQA